MKIELLFDDGSDGGLEVDAPDSFTAEQHMKELIERDKPKKLENRGEKGFDIYGTCPCCGRAITSDVDWTHFHQFCNICGQRIDWSE